MANIDKYIYDSDFIAWALGDDAQEQKWLEIIKNQPEEREGIAAAKALVSAGVKVDEPVLSPQVANRMWDNISAKNKQLKRNKKPRWPMAIAAGLAFLLMAAGLFRFLVPQQEQVVADAGQQFEYVLPDGSVVVLNAVSSITFTPKSWEDHRTLDLKGEAFFKVKKGSKFTVQTAYGQVEVLGTSFNINVRDEDWAVSCYTGKVEVRSATEKVILTAGEMSVGQQILQKKRFAVSKNQKPQWNQGIFHFDNQRLRAVFATIERQYGVKITVKEVDSLRRFSGTISNKNIDMALRMVCEPMDLKYKIEGKHVLIQ